MSHDDYAVEPIRGLPAELPEGENILWQGAPTWRTLAQRAFHVRKVAFYFAVLVAWRVIMTLVDGGTVGEAAFAGGVMLIGMVSACAILTGLAWAYARSTVFTITNRRVVLRFGIALPMAVNLPFKVIEAIKLREFGDKSGDIVLSTLGRNRVSYFPMWPYVRPMRFAKPEPMLRGLPEAKHAAEILGQALAAYVEAEEGADAIAEVPVSKPHTVSVKDAVKKGGKRRLGGFAAAGGS